MIFKDENIGCSKNLIFYSVFSSRGARAGCCAARASAGALPGGKGYIGLGDTDDEFELSPYVVSHGPLHSAWRSAAGLKPLRGTPAALPSNFERLLAFSS